MKAGSWASWRTEPWLHRLYGVAALVGALLLAKLAGLLLAPWTDHPALDARFDRMELCLDVALSIEQRRHALHALLARPMPEPGLCWRTVTLPHVEEASAGSVSLRSPVARAWYRARFTVPEDWPATEPLLIYAPRAAGLAWQVRVDGEAIADNLDDWRMTWIRPVTATVPAGLIRPGKTLDIDLLVAYVPQAGHALTRVSMGTANALGPTVRLREFLQFTMPQACSIVLLVVGTFFFGFWLTRRQETSHLLLALASVAWSVCNLQYVLRRADDPAIESWYSTLVTASVTWFMWLVYLFALRFHPRRLRWAEWLLPTYVLAMAVLTLPHFGVLDDQGVAFLSANDLVAASITLLICSLAVRSKSLELRIIAVTLLLALAAGTHDIALLAGMVPPEHLYLLPYTGILIFGSFLFAVHRRYVHAIGAYEVLNESLAHQLAEREAALIENHRRLRELERQQTVIEERQRLMRDMHDGLGSTLTSSLVAMERGQVQPGQVVEMLRDCVDELRIVIDSLAPGEQDLAAVLATLRFRMERRLAHAGIVLDWSIDDVPALPWLGPSEIVHVLRILQEGLANISKHARARNVRISLSTRDQGVEVRCADDGCGFDASAQSPGRGLRSMRQRSEILGAELAIGPGLSGGSELRLRLPLRR